MSFIAAPDQSRPSIHNPGQGAKARRMAAVVVLWAALGRAGGVGDIYRDKRMVLVGPSKQVTQSNFSSYITEDDLIVRLNLKVVDGSVWIPPKVASFTSPRTHVVCHHSAPHTEKGLFNEAVRKEDAMHDYTLQAYHRHGVKEMVCAEPARCDRVIKLRTKGVKVSRLQPDTIRFSKKRQYSTGLKCIRDMLCRPILELVIIGCDWHMGGKVLSYQEGYNELAAPKGKDMSKITVAEQEGGWHNFTNELRVFENLLKTEPRLTITQHLKDLLESNLKSDLANVRILDMV
mmetsp:Transcript_14092/g.26981  ORF Transcript_14092/g.26981 Transcript_14092/m.26981 type:complete len:289 (+) Transcript_14092:299-1165(+)|eukprot:CAMPEP_0114229280 /NCGR_PEP_ID=MMETSP0058-20121206/2818_1 /TAXON_ID=36894 /ORGANISM="Pyramimonas parkeae, CCMP726" /LENGTH=288 /DNA_ID=CAMNT_0001340335 /DNA_START=235 /DNA_END=1101 /DNA_ORIENTATION=+